MDCGRLQSDDQVPAVGESPPHPWEDVAFAQWNDWRWQVSHRLQSLSGAGHDDPDGVAGLLAGHSLIIAPEGWRGIHGRLVGTIEAGESVTLKAPPRPFEPPGQGNGRGQA